jgi:hypothetical protein
MNNTKVLEEFFIWEENNSTEPKMKLENKTESEQKDSMINTKTVNEYENWKTITNPKLRKKMRNKAYYEKNKKEILKRIKVTGKVYRENNKDRFKKYYGVNKENILSKKKIYNELNKDKIKLQKKDYYKINRNKIKSRQKDYRDFNKDKIKLKEKECYKINKEKINKRDRNRKKRDIQYKLKKNLRCRLNCAINNNQKVGSAVKDLGCTIPELKTYLESKFSPDMTWENWSINGWHIDHIKPISSFDLTDRKQLLEACHYTNLQPLWAKDNLLKSDTVA